MKKFCLFFLLAIGTSLTIVAQGVISGRIFDEYNVPIQYVSAVITQRDSLITGVMSDIEGRFQITNIKNGKYKLHISYLGYKSYEKEFVIGNLNKILNFGNITLHESTIEIEDVVVTARKQNVSAALDKKSYSTTDVLAYANGSVLDAMKQLPGVTVDQESKVQLRGSDKVVILIDGKQSSLTGFGDQKGLENIPASQIESIEIINNPSAKYDAAGMAGIVNIKFKQQQNSGFNGDIGFSFGLGQLSRRDADLPSGMSSYSNNPKYTPSINLNYKTKNVNVFLQSYWVNQKKLPNNEFSNRKYPNGDITESQVAENRSQNHYNVKFGADWFISKNQTLTVFGLYDYEWHIDTTRVWYFKNNNYENPIRKWSFNESEGTGFTNVTVQHKFRFTQPGHELNSQYLFTKGWEDETYNLYQDETADFKQIIGDKTQVIAPEYVHQFSSDYVKPLSWGRLEAGVQARLRNMPIDYLTTRSQANTALIFDFGDWSKWREDLAGIYLNLVSELNIFDIEAGLRGEYTNVEYKFAPNQYFKDNRYDYFKLFPNVRLTLKATPNNKISLFYNRRIDRPGEDILRIFPKYDDPELLKIGNPELRPQLTDAVEAAYRYMWDSGSFFIAGYGKKIYDYYTRIYIQSPIHENITIKGYSNISKATNLGLEANIDQQFGNVWKINLNGNIYRNTIFAHKGVIDFPTPVSYNIEKQSDNPWFVKMNNLFNLSSCVKFELSGVYFSKKAIAQGEELSRWGVDLGLKTSLLKNKLEINLSANDIFNTMGIRQIVDQGNGYITEYRNFYETQVVAIGMKYKF